MAAALCFAISVFSLTLWIQDKANWANLFFSLAAFGAGFYAVIDLHLNFASDIEEHVFLLKISHVGIALIFVGLIWFIIHHFNTARRWLGMVIIVTWGILLLINFFSPYSLVYSSYTDLIKIDLNWGESIYRFVGNRHPGNYVADLMSLLFLIFIVDASIKLWRKGDRRRAYLIGGSITLFILAAGIHTPLVDIGYISSPYLIVFAYLFIVLAAGFEITFDIIRSAHLSKEVVSNERRWRTLLENVQLLVVGLDRKGNINYVNPFFLKFSGYNKNEILGKYWFDQFLPSNVRDNIKKTFEEILKEGLHPHYQNAILIKDGTEKIISWSNVQLENSEGAVTGTLAIGTDDTGRIEAFEEIEKLKDQLHDENIYLQEEIILDQNHRDIIGKSGVLKYALTRVEQVALTDTIVLIEGETGVGKELFARAVHHASDRKNRPLVKVNCTAIPASLIESELFGHEKGAFTGAHKQRKGRFEIANGGTLFLDEIGELPLELQPKLLRVLEEGQFERLGSEGTITVDVRVIAATNRVLKDEVAAGRFRDDLYYRISAYPISIPPLRKRKEDIPLLLESFVEKFSRKLGRRIEKIPKHALDKLLDNPWPGNIRELRNVIESAVIGSKGGKLELSDFPQQISTNTLTELENDIFVSLEEWERRYIIKILEECQWRINGEQGAAKILDLHPNTLRNKMIKLGIRKQ